MSALTLWLSLTVIFFLLLTVNRYICCPDGFEFCANEGGNCPQSGVISFGDDNTQTYTYKPSTTGRDCVENIFGDITTTPKTCCFEDPVISTPAGIPAAAIISCDQTVYGYFKIQSEIHYYKLWLDDESHLTFDNCDSTFDTQMEAYNEAGAVISNTACPGSDDCNLDDQCSNGLKETFTLLNQPAGVYYVKIRHYTTAGSSAGLEIYKLSITCTPITADPTKGPTKDPTNEPTDGPTVNPTDGPTSQPTTADPTAAPTTATPTTAKPTDAPSKDPTADPTKDPTHDPTNDPTSDPTRDPTNDPTIDPTKDPTSDPTTDPTIDPTMDPTDDPTTDPTTAEPTSDPTNDPTNDPTTDPTVDPTRDPTFDPTVDPTIEPTLDPTTATPTKRPTDERLNVSPDPTKSPNVSPTRAPNVDNSETPTVAGSGGNKSETESNSLESLFGGYFIYMVIGVSLLILICGLGLIFCYWRRNKLKKQLNTLESTKQSHALNSSPSSAANEGNDTGFARINSVSNVSFNTGITPAFGPVTPIGDDHGLLNNNPHRKQWGSVASLGSAKSNDSDMNIMRVSTSMITPMGADDIVTLQSAPQTPRLMPPPPPADSQPLQLNVTPQGPSPHELNVHEVQLPELPDLNTGDNDDDGEDSLGDMYNNPNQQHIAIASDNDDEYDDDESDDNDGDSLGDMYNNPNQDDNDDDEYDDNLVMSGHVTTKGDEEFGDNVHDINV